VGIDVDQSRRLGKLLALCGWKVRFPNDALTSMNNVALALIDPRTLTESTESVIRKIQRLDPEVQVVILTKFAKRQEYANWIEIGARDVLTRVCSPREFLARIWRCARHYSTDRSLLTVGALSVDVGSHMCWVGEQSVSLTNTEFAILARLLQNGFVTHDEILRDVLRVRDCVETSKVRYHIWSLRQKLGSARHLLETVPPRGVRLNQELMRVPRRLWRAGAASKVLRKS
jgi:DNA-binding response OmpR family regulator